MIKLLLDQNISFRILKFLQSYFPDSTHVKYVDLINSNDFDIWKFAKQNGYTIVTHDADFFELNMLFGFPPKIICLRSGYKSTDNILNILKQHKDEINSFFNDNSIGCLEISN